MKKVVYRDILSENTKKHEVSFEERFEHPENIITKKWICKYFIEEAFFCKDSCGLKRWIRKKKRTAREKNCHVLRRYNEKTKENKILCKVLGDFFVIVGKMAYKVVYVNEVKINIKSARKVS